MYWQYFDFVRKNLTKKLDFLQKYEQRTYGSSVNRTSELFNVFLTTCVFLMFTIACFYFFTVVYHVDTLILVCFGGSIIISALICFMFSIRPYITRPSLKQAFFIFVILCVLVALGFGIYTITVTHYIRLVDRKEEKYDPVKIECPYKDIDEEDQREMRRRMELLSDIRKMVPNKKEEDLFEMLR